jgi:flagella basal body P-ring formation protein FlgA
MRFLLTLVVAASWSLVASGAEVVLRSQATLSDSIVRLGDVADLSGAGDAEVAELAVVPLLPAPAAGTQLFLDAAKVRDLLVSAGVDVRTLQIRGARTVAINSPAAVDARSQLAIPGATTVQVTPARRDREATSQRVAAAIVAYLRTQTGHDLWNVTVTADNDLVDVDWHFGPQITVTGGQAPWTGRQRFEVAGVGADKSVRAFAAVDRIETIAFALRQIHAGDFVRTTDVELRPYSGNIPTQAATSLEAVIGKEALQTIRPGAIVLNNLMRAPRLVRRGERVSVRARAAGVLVHTYATAQQDGSLGDLIQVQALEGKDRFAARVSGLRELEVFAGGTSAVEVAAAAH